MKKLENKETTILLSKDKKACYSDILSGVLEGTPAEGITIGDLRQRLSIIDTVKCSNGTIDLEDKDFEYLKGVVNNNRWGIIHRDIINMVDDINKL